MARGRYVNPSPVHRGLAPWASTGPGSAPRPPRANVGCQDKGGELVPARSASVGRKGWLPAMALRDVLLASSAAASLAAGVEALWGSFGTACTTLDGCHPVSVLAASRQPGYPESILVLVVGISLVGALVPWWSRRHRWGLIAWGAGLCGFFVLSLGVDLYWLPSAGLCLVAGLLPPPGKTPARRQ